MPATIPAHEPPSRPAPFSSLPPAVSGGAKDAAHACKILIIDDEAPNVRLLERVLSRAGFENFRSTTESRKAAVIFAEFQPDLVLTDWLMPEVDGCAVIEQLRALAAPGEYLPIIVLTADITSSTRLRALRAGATDFLTKPFDQVEVLLRIDNLLATRLAHIETENQKAALEDAVRQRTIDLEATLEELKRTQQHVIQQERLAALGTMAGGIAHDFNNALGIIMGYSEVLLSDTRLGLTGENATMPPAAILETILTAAEDGANIVHRLREFYRPDECGEQHLPLDLNKLVKQAITLTRPRWRTEAAAGGRQITVTADVAQIPLVIGDAAELREALTNLIFNAVDAMPEGGAITVGTRPDGDRVVLTVSDTGAGMSAEVRQRCLEPFFTTKGRRGTGLGLAMVFGIIRRHDGSVEIESEPGRGATFTIRLPAARQECVTGPRQDAARGDSLRILVVDDEPILCHLVSQHLQDDLHSVETAFSGKEAQALFDAGNYDLVITDHVMAEMTGEQLALNIKARRPGTPVILLTGYGGDAVSGKQYSEGIDLILAKPLSRAALRHALVKVMAGAAPKNEDSVLSTAIAD